MIINNKVYVCTLQKDKKSALSLQQKHELSVKVENREPIYYHASHIKVEIEKKKFGMRIFFLRP